MTSPTCPQRERCALLGVCQAKCPRYSLQQLQRIRMQSAPKHPKPPEPWERSTGECP